jgi:CO/xanthine dehydrogenase Mo-binding subunit
MRHHADHDGKLLRVEARFVFDGGAYASTSPAVLINGITHAQGPYKCENATVDGWAVRSNNLPCGAMRGFGVVQACFAHEGQMDKLAAALGLSPLEVRARNAMTTGDRLITGQPVLNVAPVERLIRELSEMPLPSVPVGGLDGDPMHLPGGAGRTTDVQHVRRGIGWAVSIKNLMYSEGFDDFSTARVRVSGAQAHVKFATAEVGQGFTMLAAQIVRDTLGLDDVVVDPIDTQVGSAGSTSASRQTWMSGGAVLGAARAVADRLVAFVAQRHGLDAGSLHIDGDEIADSSGSFRARVADCVDGFEADATFEHHHPPTEELDELGQGNCHTAFAFAAHRAVVDVDLELGLVKVVEVATVQDVGRALNPLSVVGQIEGGIAQGLGLAVMEEIVQVDGYVKNPSFTDYLLPTFLDMPPVSIALVEEREPLSPLGAKGVGEPPTVSSTPAIVAAIRDACGRDLARVPVRPYDICG